MPAHRAARNERPPATSRGTAPFDVACPRCGATTDVDAVASSVVCSGCGQALRVVDSAAGSNPSAPPAVATMPSSSRLVAVRPRPAVSGHVAWMSAVATLVSSGLGLRGNMEIWTISLLGDVVFVATTMAAFLATHRLAQSSLVGAVLAAFPLHWLAYGISWAVTIGEAPTGELFAFVLEIGWMGLAWCMAAVPLLHVAARAAGPPRAIRQPS